MNSQQFVTDALRTESRPESLNLSNEQASACMALMMHAAGSIDAIKRSAFYGKPVNKEKLLDQLAMLQMSTELCAGFFRVAPDPDGMREKFLADLAESNPCPLNVEHVNKRLLHATMGIFGEAGEMCEALINQGTGKTVDLINFAEELGDVDWYKAIAHDEIGVDEEAVRTAVIAKLKARYPDKFDADRAVNRDLGAERAALQCSLPTTLGDQA